jgi:hypothetical protein
MSLEYGSPRRATSRPARSKSRRDLKQGKPLPILDPDHEVLKFREWCQLNHFSERTGWRILNGADPPKLTRLSVRRFGISRKNNRDWQARRERG